MALRNRCRAIIHIVSGASPDPVGDFRAINQELALFSEALAVKPQVSLFEQNLVLTGVACSVRTRTCLSDKLCVVFRSIEVLETSHIYSAIGFGLGVFQLVCSGAFFFSVMPGFEFVVSASVWCLFSLIWLTS